jgi:hypothetical protein
MTFLLCKYRKPYGWAIIVASTVRFNKTEEIIIED